MIQSTGDELAMRELGARLHERYVIERELGRGGMGTVYLARDIRLDRLVALKVLPAEFASTPALRERFLRETKTAASFSHPNIVPVYAVEESDDLLAFVMAYVEGESLADRVTRSGPLGVRDTVRLLQDVGYALAYAHGRGVVHRDIKPDNIMIERATGRALVMDFGISRIIDTSFTISAPQGLTRVGEIVGTPEYMSPEQATGHTIDGRSDLYSLGLTAHFAVTGQRPVTGETTGQVLMRQITELLPPVQHQRSDLPPALAAAIDRCVAKDPAARFDRAEALVEALDAAQLSAPEIPLPLRLFAQEVAMLSMVIFIGVAVTLFILRNTLSAQSDSYDGLLLVVLLVGVLSARLMQTMGEVARLAAAGFSAANIQRAFEQVMAERELLRTELRSDPALVRARRKTVILSSMGIGVAVGLFRAALEFRYPKPTGGYHVEPEGNVLVVAALVLFAVCFANLVRSPLRMPAEERIFRRIWLGPLGRAFVRFSGRRVWGSQPAALGALPAQGAKPQSSTSTRAAAVAPTDPRVASLEKRVSDLERWRKTL